jgi:hypothetical protein
VQQRGDGDLFLRRVNVQDTVKAGSHDGLQIEQHDLSFELRDAVDGSLGRAEHVSRKDVFFFNTAEANAHLVTARCEWDFLFLLSIEGGYGDHLSVGHHEILVLLLDDT